MKEKAEGGGDPEIFYKGGAQEKNEENTENTCVQKKANWIL